MSAEHQTTADALAALLAKLRGPGGLGAAQCDQLASMLETVRTESRVLAKSSAALGIACEQAKEALLRCRSPEGDEAARGERLRVIGALEDMARGLAETNGLRAQWLAAAVAEVMGEKPKGGPGGVLPFGRKGKPG